MNLKTHKSSFNKIKQTVKCFIPLIKEVFYLPVNYSVVGHLPLESRNGSKQFFQ